MSCIRGISAVSVVQGFNLNFAKCIELQTDMKVAPHSLSKPYHLLKTIFLFSTIKETYQKFLKEFLAKNRTPKKAKIHSNSYLSNI